MKGRWYRTISMIPLVRYKKYESIGRVPGDRMKKRYFPQGLAADEFFCNRDQERESLKNSILSHEHVVLVAPRRYGKTSVITQTLKENNFPGVNIDFFFVLTQSEVTKTIMEGVSQILSELLPKTKVASKKIMESIAAHNPKLIFNILGQRLEIGTKQLTEKTISELLLLLDQTAEKARKTCVVVFDEFQQIGNLKENHAIEASIRHAVERSKHVSYIFCGSNRHLLNEMFSDKSRPLYRLCDLILLDRIGEHSYHEFLKKMGKKRWHRLLTENVLMEITHLTERHPYYVNALCRRLWRDEKNPDIARVRNSWAEYVHQQSIWIINDLSRITLNQRKIMTALAIQPTHELQGQEFSTKVSLSPSGVKKSLVGLQKTDMIYRDEKGLSRVLDPAVAYFIRNNVKN